MQVEKRVARDEHEVDRAAQVDVAHVAAHPLHRRAAFVRFALSLANSCDLDGRSPAGNNPSYNLASE